jgi:hypothetical protein
MAPRFDTDEMRDDAPQTEDAEERGFVEEGDRDDLGSSDLDEDDVGDIADEGSGHRG